MPQPNVTAAAILPGGQGLQEMPVPEAGGPVAVPTNSRATREAGQPKHSELALILIATIVPTGRPPILPFTQSDLLHMPRPTKQCSSCHLRDITRLKVQKQCNHSCWGL